MSMKEDFLEEVVQGDHITVTYRKELTIQGCVKKLLSGTVVLERDGISTRIPLDNLVNYDFTNGEKEKQASQPEPSAPAEPRTVTEAPAAAVPPASEQLFSGEMRLEALFREAKPADLETISNWDYSADRLLDPENDRQLRQIADNVVASLQNLLQNPPQTELELENKSHDIVAKTLKTAMLYPDNRDDLHALLASFYMQMKNYDRAEFYFNQCGDYFGAAYAALWNGNTENLDGYLDEYLQQIGQPDAYLYQQYAASAIRRKDMKAFCRRVAELSETDQSDEDQEELMLLGACALQAAKELQLPHAWASDYCPRMAVPILQNVVKTLPDGWSGLEKPVMVRTDVKPVGERVFIGKIGNFHPDKNYGFVFCDGASYYFYIAQVNLEDELRQILTDEYRCRGLEVSFRLGKPYLEGKGPSAYDICLTDRGAAEAARRMYGREVEQGGCGRVVGDMVEFKPLEMFGLILYDGTEYRVNDKGLVDPYLRAYLLDNYQCDVRVSFCPGEHKGKAVALKVRLADPKDRPSGSVMARMIKSEVFTGKDVELWDAMVEAETNTADVPELSEELYQFPYTPLEPWEGPLDHETIESHREMPVRSAAANDNDSADLPPREPLPPRNDATEFKNLPRISGDHCYDKAHRAMLKGNLEEAKAQYIQAIQAEDRLESAIADLTTVYLREPCDIASALNLLDAYGNFLPREKRLNLFLQVYQKGTDRAYRIELCYVLEQALEQTVKLGTRFHYLAMEANILRSLGEYPMALNAYRRWRQMYDSEQRYRGANGMTQFSGQLNFVTKGEAICHYLAGNREEATQLARELLRISSADETAASILNGTYSQETQSGEAQEIPTDPGDNLTEHMAISEFSKARMLEVKMSQWMKFHMEKDEYVGSIEDAQRDIDFVLNAKGKTSEARSGIYLSAARIILTLQNRYRDDSIRQKEMKSRHLTEHTMKVYLARSMAAYGNAVLESMGEPDTARYAYLQAMEVLQESEADWRKSVNHYILSYFLGKNELAAIVRQSNSTNVFHTINMECIRKRVPQDVGEFTLGMIKLHSVLKKRNYTLDQQLVQAMQDSGVFDDVAEWLQLNSPGDDALREALDQNMELCREQESNLKALMEDLPNQILSRLKIENLLSGLENGGYEHWLCVTDRDRLHTVCDLLKNFRRYFNTKEFQHRSNVLDDAIQTIINLSSSIRERPAQMSYEMLLNRLEATYTGLRETQDAHYRSQVPNVEVGFTKGVQPNLGANNEIRINLSVSNGSGTANGIELQPADNVELKVTAVEEGVKFVRIEADVAGCVYGGKAQEAILVFRVEDQQIITLGSFELEVACTYSYNRQHAESVTDCTVFRSPIVFRQEQFTEIQNPFAPWVGHEMVDEHMFFGREQTIEKLLSVLREGDSYHYGTGVLLYGQTRAGKSSIRVHFCRQARKRYPDVILVDLENLNVGTLDETMFYTRFFAVLDQELQQNHSQFRQQVGDDLIADTTEKMVMRPESAGYLFVGFMSRFSRMVRDSGKLILLVADEFSAINSAIKDGTLPESFMRNWKAMLENYGVSCICFGQDDTPLFMQQHQNVFGRMYCEQITYLASEPAMQLMDEPVRMRLEDGSERSRYTETALEELYQLTAGSAYLIVKVCSLLVEYLNDHCAEVVTPGILRNFLETGVFDGAKGMSETDFEPQINDRADNSLQDENRLLLLDIARKSQNNGWAEIRSISTEGLQLKTGKTAVQRREELLNRLHQRDVLEFSENKTCRIKVELLSRWLLFQYGGND